MNRNKIHYISGQNTQAISKENIAFHEAGHATAIYLNNKKENLPPIFFQILLSNIKNEQEKDYNPTRKFESDCIAKIEGGRLVLSFPPLNEVTDDFMTAFEADIINLLIGPLAEAKYVYQCDDEFFNKRLINIHALNFYGGRLDLELASEYLQSLYPDKQKQDEKLHQLFFTAFDFVEDPNNWEAICHLANYINESNKSIIDYEDVVSILESIESKNNLNSSPTTTERELSSQFAKDN